MALEGPYSLKKNILFVFTSDLKSDKAKEKINIKGIHSIFTFYPYGQNV
jgi:hypothetical protein